MNQLCNTIRTHMAINTSGDYIQMLCCCQDELPAAPSWSGDYSITSSVWRGPHGEAERPGFVQVAEKLSTRGLRCWLYLFGSYRKEKARLWSAVHAKRSGRWTQTTFEENSGWIIATESFTVRIVKHSNRWPRGAGNHRVGAAQSSAGQAVETSPALSRGMSKGLP